MPATPTDLVLSMAVLRGQREADPHEVSHVGQGGGRAERWSVILVVEGRKGEGEGIKKETTGR